MKVLSIGNSFSQDAHRYLHKIAKNEGEALKCVNLYIGGCSLYTHYMNMLLDKPAYSMEFNGESTGFYVSIKQALCSDEWDFVTLQQASGKSTDYDTYVPYISKLTEYVRIYVPKTKILIHQTWSYEQDSRLLNETMGFTDQHQMLELIKTAYSKAAEEISAYGIIPCGEAMMQTIEKGIEKIHRDTFHASEGAGRYLLGLIWYMTLFGKKTENTFTDFDVEVTPKEIDIVNETADDIFKSVISNR